MALWLQFFKLSFLNKSFDPIYMKSLASVALLGFLFFITSCSSSRKTANKTVAPITNAKEIKSTVKIKKKVPVIIVNTRDVSGDEVTDFAETLIGVKYTYGSTIKEKGFDCSGFINYVFYNFNIRVPRVTVDFTSVGKEVPIADCRRGDLILFTGSDENSGVVGHMGIITQNKNGVVEFIHASTSRGVMISGMNSYFVPRFVKVIRVFKVFGK
jgi:cell wall-associated NlpC family hydrolase